VTATPVELAVAIPVISGAVVAVELHVVVSFFEQAMASLIVAASELFCAKRRFDVTDPRSTLMASMPSTTPNVTSTVTMVATAPCSRRALNTASEFSHRIA